MPTITDKIHLRQCTNTQFIKKTHNIHNVMMNTQLIQVLYHTYQCMCMLQSGHY